MQFLQTFATLIKVNLCLIYTYTCSKNLTDSPFLQFLIWPFFWCRSEVCILLCEQQIEAITPAFWRLLVILMTLILGFFFTCDLSVISCCCCCCFFQATLSLSIAEVTSGFFLFKTFRAVDLNYTFVLQL